MSKHESMDYFEVLELSPDEICGKDEAAIADLVKKSHARLYRKALDSRYPIRSDGLSRRDWMNKLNEARDTLTDSQKRQEHLISLGLVDEKSELVRSKGRIWDLADSVGNEYTGEVVRTTTSCVEVEIHIRPDETCLVPISQMGDGSAGAVVQIGDEVTVRIPAMDNRGQIDVTLIAVRGVPVHAHHRQRIPREATVTKPDAQPSKDNRGVGGKQPRQPVPEEAKVNKGDARLPGWVRVWGGLWCVIIPGLILLLWLSRSNSYASDPTYESALMISLGLAILGFGIWVLGTLCLEKVSVRTKVGVVFKVIVAMLAAFTFFCLSGFLIAYYLGYY